MSAKPDGPWPRPDSLLRYNNAGHVVPVGIEEQEAEMEEFTKQENMVQPVPHVGLDASRDESNDGHLWDRLAAALTAVEDLAAALGEPVEVNPQSCFAGELRLHQDGTWERCDGLRWARVDLGSVLSLATLEGLLEALEGIVQGAGA